MLVAYYITFEVVEHFEPKDIALNKFVYCCCYYYYYYCS